MGCWLPSMYCPSPRVLKHLSKRIGIILTPPLSHSRASSPTRSLSPTWEGSAYGRHHSRTYGHHHSRTYGHHHSRTYGHHHSRAERIGIILTPPLPLPYMGGERLRAPSSPRLWAPSSPRLRTPGQLLYHFQRKNRFSLVFRSLIRTSGCAEGTSARKNQRKIVFSLVFRSLIRTFGPRYENNTHTHRAISSK